MAYHTFQIAIKNDDGWVREYVCAKDRMDAVNAFIVDNPPMTMEKLVQIAMTAEVFEVEACA